MSESSESPSQIKLPPTGLAIVALVGPSLIWCAEYIGSGEVVLATRAGAILGVGVLWAVVLSIFLKYWIGLSGGIYTVCTGEGMIDMFARMPGPRNWAVWIVLLVQLSAGAVSMGGVASAAGAFLATLTGLPSYVAGWLATAVAVYVVWSGEFRVLKIVMSGLVAVTVLGIVYVSAHVWPPLGQLLAGLIPGPRTVPEWALAANISDNPWHEILPLIGWAAGGFASQVWYTYWVLGAKYGAASDAKYGQPANLPRLQQLSSADGVRLKKWCRVIHVDATVALVIGTVTTGAFLIAGAGILGAAKLAPDGPDVAKTLSRLFSEDWGRMGAQLFILGGATALLSTLIGQFAGWPRLVADALRICVPAWNRHLGWKAQFRILLLLFLATNMLLVYTLGYNPLPLIRFSAIFDGLLLIPFQALWVGLGLFVVMPKMLSPEAYRMVRPSPVIALGLLVAGVAFSLLCLIQVPGMIRSLVGGL